MGLCSLDITAKLEGARHRLPLAPLTFCILRLLCVHSALCFVFQAMVEEECVGAIVCKLDMHKKMFRRGYIAMLAVDSKYRRKGIGKTVVASYHLHVKSPYKHNWRAPLPFTHLQRERFIRRVIRTSLISIMNILHSMTPQAMFS